LTRHSIEEEVSKQYPTRFFQLVNQILPNLEAFMTSTVILAVGLDSSLLENHISVWQSFGLIVTFVGSIKDAIVRFRDGDFDVILLGHSIPGDSRERLTFLIRASGSRVPVVCISDSPGNCDSSADAAIKDEPTNFLEEIGELIANRARVTVTSSAMARITT
jgi:DNA-binding NtrC family response regulator